MDCSLALAAQCPHAVCSQMARMGLGGPFSTRLSNRQIDSRRVGRVPNRNRRCVARAEDLDVDVAVIGGGVIGMCVARPLLQAGLRVALIERDQPCAGATGAGDALRIRNVTVPCFPRDLGALEVSYRSNSEIMPSFTHLLVLKCHSRQD
jgi:ribulose 1,5-bisphosphate synthetase/thiazole synthase